MKTVAYHEATGVSLEAFDPSKYNVSTETYWEDFKKFVGFDDETLANKKISDLQSSIKDVKLLKSKISQSSNSENVNIKIRKAIKKLPVEGKTGAEICRELTKLRKECEKIYKKSLTVKTKEEHDKIKEEINDLKNNKYDVSESIQINRSDLLHICDEINTIAEMEIEIIKEGLKTKKDNNLSTESYVESIEAVAIENFFSKIGATVLFLLSIFLLTQAMHTMMLAFMIASAGLWGFAIGLGLLSIAAAFTSLFMTEKAEELWNKKE